ncbi:MAG TPA: DUF3574 domain-containing protein [Acetobacteraceae bacterium]|nr:DUF3574 domain-containing protein [Acetobacteraceae bacterium]
MRAALALLLLAAACAAPAGPPAACPAGMGPATVAEAYLGQGVRGRGEVTEAEWSAFLAEIVTPAFPDGLTVLDARGQWRGQDGQVARERSKVLLLVMPGADMPAVRARLAPVEAAWKARFNQESVLTVLRPGCAGF